MAQADGQGSVTFSDQTKPTGRFSDTSCSWRMQDGQERGKESESGQKYRIDCGSGWNQAPAANWTEREETGRVKRKKKNVPIHAGLLVGCLFRVRPFSKRVFD